MWMVGYNEGGDFNNMVDHSFNGRKLKPLMPRPMTSLNNAPTTTPPSLTHVHANDFLSQYHYHHLVAEQNKREELNGAAVTVPVVVSTRWNPTPDQLRALEELYRRGTRTPSAEQIQHITSQLRRFGNIEGKNVFYWFQNHKARERQKRRRQMDQYSDIAETPQKKDLAASRTVFEVERTKNWTHSTNFSTIAEESVSTQRTAKAVAAESRTEGWILFDEGELQERRNFLQERNARWHVMQLPCPSSAPVTHHLINTPTNASSPTSMATTTLKTTIMDPSLIKTHDLSFFISPQRENSVIHLSSTSSSTSEDDNSVVEFQTLQLFPLRSDGDRNSHNIEDKDMEISASAMNANNFTPSQFYEFLPVKD